MSYYGSVTGVRRILNLSTDDITDTDLADLLEDASKQLLEMISVRVVDEEVTTLVGDKSFYVRYAPIADSNFDKSVDSSDITVYKWTTNYPDSKTELTVSSVVALEGYVTLSSRPSGYTKLTVDYRYYPTPIVFENLDICANYLCAYLYTVRETLLLPYTISMGTPRISYGRVKPFKEMFLEFERVYSTLFRHVAKGRPELSRTGLVRVDDGDEN